MTPPRTLLVALLLASPGLARADDPKLSPEGVEFFEKKVRPVLVEHCYRCHSADAKKIKGELRVDTRDGLLKGGASGPAVVPGSPDKSLLVTAVRHADPAPKMPPDRKLTATQIADLEAWVKMGAPDPRTGSTASARLDPSRAQEFWSFRPVVDPPVPAVKDAAWPRSPLDRFVLAKLEANGHTPVGPADRRVLIRRATFDLIGLPPTPEEVDAFLADDSPAAFATVVDRLLASPHYGERWGRHWLDVIRYSDTAGDNSDYPVPQMYRYRNWVIDAVNRDLPYDEFVRQQLAGDLMPAADEADRRAKLIATGYLANARRFGSYEDDRYPWHLTYEDTIDNFGKALLGLTIGCCRCHDHKFDPLSQADYYALYGFFASTRYPRPGIELDKVQRDFVPLAPPEQVAAFEAGRDRKAAEVTARMNLLQARGASIDDIKAVRKEWEVFASKPPFEMGYAVAEGETKGKRKVGNACIQIKGDPERIGAEVPRRFPTALGGQTLPADAKGSGRLELARWTTDPRNPLFARVMVNRVWHLHFGAGLVRTPENFGKLGRAPTHPELLDWLAARFVEDGFSVKALHRRVMLSRTYQMASTDHPANAARDVANESRWRFDRRRLDAESIRDALLAVGGNLDRTPGGPHPFPEMPTWNFTQHNPFKAVYDHDRRSVYLITQRIQRHPFLALFDGADANAGTAARTTSTTPLQALYLMNDPFVHAQAKRFAARVMVERGDDRGRVERAFLLLYGRPPGGEEAAAALAYLARVAAKLDAAKPQAAAAAAWESLARALFLSNEFVYVD
ncbi:MAG: PSD1 and planctomycete cytochrome C domain-containing protein [Gemmataceae bacterium]|nr:PSD1 and planctomycete cytochrome C domain-containing protein [Gemmataceae bacterium]